MLDTFTVRRIAVAHDLDPRTLVRAFREGVGAIRGEAVRLRVQRALDDLARALAERAHAPAAGRRT